MKTTIWITTIFEAFHRWKDAPEEVYFLRAYHRHIFEVEIGVAVRHDDRDIEFLQFKDEVNEYIKKHFERKRFELSCEMIAKRLFNEFTAEYVKVSEDGENGATIERE